MPFDKRRNQLLAMTAHVASGPAVHSCFAMESFQPFCYAVQSLQLPFRRWTSCYRPLHTRLSG